ncbi:MAG: hypothetical protein OSB03_17875, partial [Vicinamibacterales bacterium]|nr:hypothetical protein [Vicinamibacterales bacterium]
MPLPVVGGPDALAKIRRLLLRNHGVVAAVDGSRDVLATVVVRKGAAGNTAVAVGDIDVALQSFARVAVAGKS